MQHQIKSGAFCLIFFLLNPFQVQAQDVTYKDGVFEISHTEFTKQFQISDRGNSRIIPLLMDQKGENILAEANEIPYFEFVLENTKISALDPVWKYIGYDTRKMGNEGYEVIIRLEGTKAPVKDLQISIYQQFFPNSTLIREKIALMAKSDDQFTLNKLNGQLHFVFPQYGINSNAPATSTEIRIASFASEIIEVDQNAAYDERFPEGNYNDFNLAYNHMYHPRIINRKLEEGKPITTKGPFSIINNGTYQWITAYEHASQDDLRGVFKEEIADGELILDAGQGIHGVFNFPISASDFHFLGFYQQQNKEVMQVGLKALRGAYFDGEAIEDEYPYTSVWTATAFSNDTSTQESRAIIHDYLWKWICEKPASRKPEFYYNTWGMQRRVGKVFPDIRELMTEENIIAEIGRAAEMNVDIFVLDDGWEQAQGNWTPHKDRLPNGLAPIKAELDKYGIKMGIWLSPMGIDSSQQRYKDHPEWVIKDSDGNPILAQWRHPAFDFVSGFYDVFIEDCKRLIDAGARFFKWDAINTFYSSVPNLHHGSDQYSDQEIRARYEYLLPIYVTGAMEELTNYEPELIIEIDLTEARRVMTGLAPLSQGKLFWMNNGASGYNDYSVYRAKSMRSIPNRYAGIIPLELFTYANYPQNADNAQRYNVNTSLISGHGFWGSLKEVPTEERIKIGQKVDKSKAVLPYVVDLIPEVIGRVGSSPEIYSQVNPEEGAGQVIAFSGSALEYQHQVKIKQSKVLGVLNHAYNLKNDALLLNFQFPMPDASREAFIIPNEGTPVSMIASTSWIDDMNWQPNRLIYMNGAPGKQIIEWAKSLGKPSWAETPGFKVDLEELSETYLLTIEVNKAGQKVEIRGDL
ncbi:MAG: alpha-galactosidase [Candidatus Cyclobacteriaceae bacterium M3_2C_046]